MRFGRIRNIPRAPGDSGGITDAVAELAERAPRAVTQIVHMGHLQG